MLLEYGDRRGPRTAPTHPRGIGGARTATCQRETGGKHHLICDGRGAPLKHHHCGPRRRCQPHLRSGRRYPTGRRSFAAVRVNFPRLRRRQGLPLPHCDELRNRRIPPAISFEGDRIPGHGRAQLRRRANLRPLPPFQTTCHPLGTRAVAQGTRIVIAIQNQGDCPRVVMLSRLCLVTLLVEGVCPDWEMRGGCRRSRRT